MPKITYLFMATSLIFAVNSRIHAQNNTHPPEQEAPKLESLVKQKSEPSQKEFLAQSSFENQSGKRAGATVVSCNPREQSFWQHHYNRITKMYEEMFMESR